MFGCVRDDLGVCAGVKKGEYECRMVCVCF